MAKKKKAKKRSGGANMMTLASRNKAFKAAKRAQAKADARAKKAWRRALAVAKKKVRSRKRR